MSDGLKGKGRRPKSGKPVKRSLQGDFAGGPVVRSLPANAGDMGSISGLGRYHMPQST